jgi:hypothetical protein
VEDNDLGGFQLNGFDVERESSEVDETFARVALKEA